MARLHGKRWLADVRTPDGERLRPSFATEKEADNWEAEAKLAVEQGRPIPPPKTGKGRGRQGPRNIATLGALFEHVRLSEWQHRRSAYTLIHNARDVVNYFGTNRAVDTIGAQEIAEMRVAFGSRGLAPSTVNRKAAALSKMLQVALEAGVIAKAPRIRYFPEEQTKFRYLDATEEAVLLSFWKGQNDDTLHDLCVLLLDTGARCYSEMLPAKWDDFGQGFGTVTFWQTKTGKPRTVPLTERCKAILRERQRLSNSAPGPFYGHGGRHVVIGKNTMRGRWDTMRALTGLHDVTPHTLRHTCCTRLVLGGVDVKRVMTWMGHTTIATTMRYMQIKPTALEDVLHVLEGRAA